MLFRRRFRNLALALFFGASLLITSVGFPFGASSFAQESADTSRQGPAALITEGIQKTVLDNGMTVLLKPVNTAPVVTVQIAYGVGPINEGEGESGLSHQLEHMMFKGTKERPIQFGRLFSALGSRFNAFVTLDQTVYFNTVGSNKLEAVLTLEADRMKNALIEPDELAREKQVVISEIQGNENNPSYLLRRELLQAAYPDRAYGRPGAGLRSDVEAFTPEQTKAYYEKYYNPNNATLVVVGDFEPAETLATIESLFGSLTNSAEAPVETGMVAPLDAIALTPQSEPLLLQQPGGLPLIQAIYPLPNTTHPDTPAIDVLDTILTSGRTSRLNQALVETDLAIAVSSSASTLREPGFYLLEAELSPDQSPAEIYDILQQSLGQLQQQPVSAEELARAKEQFKASIGFLAQDVTGQGQVLSIVHTTSGDYQQINQYLAALDAVTIEDVQRVAQTYLAQDKSAVGFFEPTTVGQPAPPVPSETENFAPSEPVSPEEVAQYLPPIPEATAAADQPLPEQLVLDNGLKVLLLPGEGTPTLSMNGWIDAGERFDRVDKAGIAGLTLANIINGTETRDALTLALTVESQGIQFSSGIDTEGANFSANALAEDLPLAIDALSDILQNAIFPEEQIASSKQQSAAKLAATLNDPRGLSAHKFQQALYPEGHPARTQPTPESIAAVTREDIQSFYDAHYRPDSTVITIVGGFNMQEAKSLIAEAFGGWEAVGDRPTVEVPDVPLPESIQRSAEPLPGTAEAITIMGYETIPRSDPRFYAFRVVNEVLGGGVLSSRLATTLRDQQGLTYSVGSALQAGIDLGPFIISMQTAPENVDRAIESAIAILAQVRAEGLTSEEVENAKRAIIDRYPVLLADPSFLSSLVLSNDVNALAADEIQSYPAKIAAVTDEEIGEAIAAFIQPDRLVITTVTPPTPNAQP